MKINKVIVVHNTKNFSHALSEIAWDFPGSPVIFLVTS